MRTILASLLLLAACGEEPTPPPAADTVPPAATIPSEETMALSASDLAGEFRVAGIDGGEVEGEMGIGLTIADGVISYEPRCLGFVWSVADGDNGLLDIARHPDYGPQRAPDGTQVVCQPSVTPAFGQLAQALDAVTRAERSPANGIVLSGGGHSVTLFTQ